MKTSLTKSDFLSAQACLKQVWLGLRTDPPALTEADRFRMEEGSEVGRRARELFPHGKLVSGLPGKSAAAVTAELVAAGEDVLFEAAFVAGPFAARADILSRGPGGFHVLEVKSSFSDTKKIKELVDDLAYTVMIAKRAGLSVTITSLVLLSRDYRFGDGVEKLFQIVDKTEEVVARVKEFEAAADGIAATLASDSLPDVVLVSACRHCFYFEEKCLGAGIDHSVLELPNLHHTRLKRLSALGIVDISEVPSDIELNETQFRAKTSALSGKRIVEPRLEY